MGLPGRDLGAVDRLPADIGDVVGRALGQDLLDRRLDRVALGNAPAARSSKRLTIVSCASFLLVPMTPEGPRLIQPTA